MSRYIDADRLPIKVWNGDFVGVSKNDIEQTPTEDVAPIVRGKWGYKGANWFCSNCNIQFCDNPEDFKYCPMCGAKMEGVEE